MKTLKDWNEWVEINRVASATFEINGENLTAILPETIAQALDSGFKMVKHTVWA